MRFFYKGMLVFLIMHFTVSLLAQTQSELAQLQAERQEFYFKLSVENPNQIEEINELVSIDQLTSDGCIAYANPLQYAKLLSEGYKPELLMPPSLVNPNQPMTDVADLKNTNDWDTYPTYPAYVAMMQAFADNYPNLCTIHNIGTLASGRQLLVARINNGEPSGKPEFLYTSSIHGDETTGYVLTLRLIDYLLQNYGINDEVTQLVDGLDIWINPLANPDGTYYGGNNTVNGARRGNANNVDMNRNYPDPEDGPHPDGNAWQPETVYFMAFGEERNFTMAANFHGGAEVLNYPWDTWVRRHADDNWWIYVCREYADTVHLHAPAGYLTDLNNGITNGYDWYTIDGGRQDYMNYFEQCREITLEISDIKLLPASMLPAWWNYNNRSLINYMKQATFGFRGVVTDSITGEPILAQVEIVGHDLDNSFVRTSLPSGSYFRPIKAGTYDLTFTAEGYYSKTIHNLSITDKQVVVVDAQLAPGIIIADFTASAYEIPKGGNVNFYDNTWGQNIATWNWEFEGGVPATSTAENPVNITYAITGEYDVTLTVTDANGQSSTITKTDLIKVSSMYIMTSGTFSTCEGTFFDPGGPDADYSNNQDVIMTIIPDTEEALTRVLFTLFDLEAQSNCDYDWLKIYNGLNTSAPLLGTWCGSNSPGTIIANNGGKGLTFHFHSDGSVVKQGWAAEISCFSTVGIDNPSEAVVNIYPNPTNGNRLRISSGEPLTNIQIFDLNGHLVYNQALQSINETEIDLYQLKPAVYMIHTSTARTNLIQKLTLSR